MLCTLLCVTLLCTSCDTDNVSQTGTSSGDVSHTDGESRYVADVEPADYGGQQLVFLIRGQEHGDFETWDFQAEETTSEVINTALEERYYYIDATFNVQLTALKVGGERNYGTMYEKVMLENTAQTGEFDVIYCPVYDMTSHAINGRLYDLSEVGILDFSKPWWDKEAMDDIAVGNRYFGAVGDISVQITETCQIILFNKDMISSLGLENPYTLVEDNHWTLDKMASMAKNVYNDNNASANVDIGDTFGIGGQNDTMFSYLYGGGVHIAELDDEGTPYLTINTSSNIDYIQKIFDLMTDNKTFMCANDYFGIPGFVSSPTEYIVDAFSLGRMLFYSEGLLHVEDFRDSAVDFGLLPTPLADENQEEYAHLIGTWGATVVSIPLSCQKLEMACTVVEAMAAESKNTLSPAYYEDILAMRDTRDNESAGSLEIILNSIGFDVGHSFNWGEVNEIFGTMLNTEKMEFASMYDAKKNAINDAMEKTGQAFAELPSYIVFE